MLTVRTIRDVRRIVAEWRREGLSIGFVPTMGSLHAGHAALVQASAAGCDRTVVSVFVNPTQFGANEDFSRYPRDEEGDRKLAAGAGSDLFFAPEIGEVYPGRPSTSVHVAGLTDGLCGVSRPGHFDGVALVVTKLFNIVQPDRAYFGEKDFQQLAVIRRLVRDLDIPVRVVGKPTVRDKDGLALSSRNRYLSPTDRKRALALSRTLREAQRSVRRGQRDAAALRDRAVAALGAQPGIQLEYLDIVDPSTLRPVRRIGKAAQMVLAARVGTTRLIDNLRLERDVRCAE